MRQSHVSEPTKLFLRRAKNPRHLRSSPCSSYGPLRLTPSPASSRLYHRVLAVLVCRTFPTRRMYKMRDIAIALLTVVAMLAPSLAHADGPVTTFVGCPVGQAIRGINFVTRALVCQPVGGDTAALQAQITALQNALTSAQATIACMHAVGTDVFFEGCNVHIVSGAGSTDAAVNGLGNLIVG